MIASGVSTLTTIGINNFLLLYTFSKGGGGTVYLTVFAVFIIALGMVTSNIGTYSTGGIYVTESGKTTIGLAIVCASLDLIYEIGKFLLKWLLKP
jgi:hypothetical protein